MNKITKFPLITVVIACLTGIAAVSSSAFASGLQLYEISTPDIGLASAGYAARAQDAATLFRNPAGMSQLPGSQLQASAGLLYGNARFAPDASTGSLLGNDDGGNAIGALPSGSIFFTQQLNDRFSVGLGAFSYFGLAAEYNSDWVGRYYIQKDALMTLSFMPAASFKVNDWLSIGAGFNAMYGRVKADAAIRTGGSGDGQLSLEDSSWGFGGNAGILIEPKKGTRFGVTYVSAVKLSFTDKPQFKNTDNLPIPPNLPGLDIGMTVPQSVMLGAYHELNAQWAIMADVGWQNWRQFGTVDVGVDSATPTNITTNLKYKDTWHGAIGAQFRATERWTFMTGFAYDSSCVDDADRTLSLPIGEAYRIGLGAQWQMSKSVNLAAAYEFVWMGDLPVTQDSTYRGRVSGSYNNTSIQFVSIGVQWKF